MQERVGQQFGNYRLVRPIGQGGYSEVYLAEHIHLRTPAAIKILIGPDLEDFQRAEFLAEAQTIANLQRLSSHIVQIQDFGIDSSKDRSGKGIPYLVMEYAAQGTLRNIFSRANPMPLARVVFYINQIAEALQCAHDQRPPIVHCDVKPENMLLRSMDHVLLSDFGIAMKSNTKMLTGSGNIPPVVGTAAYVAPERFKGIIARAGDQYSLAIVVYELLCGECPFEGTEAEIIAQHRLVEPDPLSMHVNVPQEVEDAVARALQKKPEDRYPSVREFAQALAKAARLPGPQVGQAAQQPRPQIVQPVQQPRPQIRQAAQQPAPQVGQAAQQPRPQIVQAAPQTIQFAAQPASPSDISAQKTQQIADDITEPDRQAASPSASPNVQPQLVLPVPPAPKVTPQPVVLPPPVAPQQAAPQQVVPPPVAPRQAAQPNWRAQQQVVQPNRYSPYSTSMQGERRPFDFSTQFLSESRGSFFRILGYILNFVSVIVLAYQYHNILVVVVSLLFSCLMFTLCILAVEEPLAMFFGALVALYWGGIGWTVGVIAAPLLPAGGSALSPLLAVIFCAVSFALHFRYIQRKN